MGQALEYRLTWVLVVVAVGATAAGFSCAGAFAENQAPPLVQAVPDPRMEVEVWIEGLGALIVDEEPCHGDGGSDCRQPANAEFVFVDGVSSHQPKLVFWRSDWRNELEWFQASNRPIEYGYSVAPDGTALVEIPLDGKRVRIVQDGNWRGDIEPSTFSTAQGAAEGSLTHLPQLNVAYGPPAPPPGPDAAAGLWDSFRENVATRIALPRGALISRKLDDLEWCFTHVEEPSFRLAQAVEVTLSRVRNELVLDIGDIGDDPTSSGARIRLGGRLGTLRVAFINGPEAALPDPGPESVPHFPELARLSLDSAGADRTVHVCAGNLTPVIPRCPTGMYFAPDWTFLPVLPPPPSQ